MKSKMMILLEKGKNLYQNREDLYCEKTRIIYTLFFVLLPILNQYRLTFIGFADVFLLITVLLMFCRRKPIQFKSTPMWIFCIWCLAVTAIFSWTLKEMTVIHYVLKMMRLSCFLFALYYGAKEILYKDLAVRLYTVVVMVCTVIIYIQYLLYITAGRGTVVLIPLMEISYGDMTALDLATVRQHLADFKGYRPSSLFMEPAWHALYVLPWLSFAISKIREANRKDILGYIFVSMGLVLSGSSIGIIIAFAIWLSAVVDVIKSRESIRLTKKSLILIIVVLVVVVGVVIFLVWDVVWEKVSPLLNATTPSTATVRILRGFYCFAKMDVLQQLVGAGNGNLTLLFIQEELSTVLDEGLQIISYMSGIGTLLCTFGLAGTVIYVISLGKLLKCKHNMLPSILCLCLIMIASDYYDTAFYFLFMVLMQVWAEHEHLRISITGKK